MRKAVLEFLERVQRDPEDLKTWLLINNYGELKYYLGISEDTSVPNWMYQTIYNIVRHYEDEIDKRF